MAGDDASEPILASFRALGTNLKRDWLRQCIAHVKSRAAPRVLREDELRLHVYTTVLHTDLRTCADHILPPGVAQMADRCLPGPFIVQVVEMMNIGEAKETRDKQTAKRCLRLLLTDGQQSVKAFEYRMLPDLRIETPVGTKLVIRNASVRSGMLLLESSSVRVLGGGVAGDDGAEVGGVVVVDGAAARPPPPPPPPGSVLPIRPALPASASNQQQQQRSWFDDEEDDIDWSAIPDPSIPTTATTAPTPATLSLPTAATSTTQAATVQVSPFKPPADKQAKEVIYVDDDTPPSTAGSSSGSSTMLASASKCTGRATATTDGHTTQGIGGDGGGPFVSLLDLGRHAGQVVVVKAFAMCVKKASMVKDKGLRIVIVLDDGSHAISARLGDAVMKQVVGTTSGEFLALRKADSKAADELLAMGQSELSRFEGVMEIKVPASGEAKGAAALPEVLSKRPPTVQELRRMVDSCSSLTLGKGHG